MTTQTHTIFHTEMMRQRSKDGSLSEPQPHVSVYAACANSADRALQDTMEDIAECRSNDLQEDFSDDPGEYESLLSIEVDSLPGTWEVYKGVLQERPKGVAPILSEGS